MTSIKSIGLAAVTLVAAIASANAAERLTMKPQHGVSFAIGSERAVGYFLRENETCKLVLTLAGEPDWDNPGTFVSTRFETVVTAEKTVRYGAKEGKVLKFSCGAGAQTMSITGLDETAANAY